MPWGVRIGGPGQHTRAAKVWGQRRYKDLDGDRELGTRNLKIALRRLRKFARDGATEELDLDNTIDATARWLGASRSRRMAALGATIWILSREIVLVKDVERLVGNVSYCQAFRSCTRSTFQEVYPWLAAHQRYYRHQVVLPPAAWYELLLASFLLPLMQQELDSPE